MGSSLSEVPLFILLSWKQGEREGGEKEGCALCISSFLRRRVREGGREGKKEEYAWCIYSFLGGKKGEMEMPLSRNDAGFTPGKLGKMDRGKGGREGGNATFW